MLFSPMTKKILALSLVVLGGFLWGSATHNRSFEAGLSMPSEDFFNQGAPYLFEGETYTSWFDGVVFDHQQFVEHYSRQDLSNNDLLQIYLYLDRLGGRIVFAKTPLLLPEEMKALYSRRIFTRELVRVRNKSQFLRWKNHVSSSVTLITKEMSKEEKRRFFLFFGLTQKAIEQQKVHDDVVFPGNIRLTSTSNATKAALYPAKVIGFYTPYTDEHLSEGFGGVESSQVSIERLRQTMTDVGLWGVKLPLGSVEKPQDIDDFTKQLVFYNKALEKRTKLSKALGINGRVLWFLDKGHQNMTDAYSTKIRTDIVFIQSTWSSYAHEWFHALDWTTHDWDKNQGDEAMEENMMVLQKDIRYKGLNAKQWKTLMRESIQSSDAFLQQQWGLSAYRLLPETQAQALQYSFDHVVSPYDAAMLASHVYWLKRPGTYKKLSSWVGRRMIAEDMLRKSKWSDNTSIVDSNYYANASEWTAAAFQGDITGFIDGGRPKNVSLMKMPLDTEIKAYRPLWDRFFKVLQPAWNRESNPLNVAQTSKT